MHKITIKVCAISVFCFVFAHVAPAAGLRVQGRAEAIVARESNLSPADDAFLEDLSRRSFRFFWEQADPRTGLVRDRARADGSTHTLDRRDVASIAATGFGLTALCIADERGWVAPALSRERVRTTLRFLLRRAPHKRGWLPHFMDAHTGARIWQSEYSSIDTALLLAGVLSARAHFRGDKEIERLATELYTRVDFRWMLAGHPTLLSHGWKPETGFLKPRWDTYSEHLILNLLAIGSPSHSIPPAAWRAWRRGYITYAGHTYMTGGVLFTHQFSHAWIDFRERYEDTPPHTNYFRNSVTATHAHRRFCLDLAPKFPGYTTDVWGITASDSRRGYVAWGGPPADSAIDGSVVPCAAGGSLMFTPDIALPALRTMRERFGERIYKRYGFVDAFHPLDGWTNPDVIGIDTGITLLAAENLRSGFVWQTFMRNKEITSALNKVGLTDSAARAESVSPG